MFPRGMSKQDMKEDSAGYQHAICCVVAVQYARCIEAGAAARPHAARRPTAEFLKVYHVSPREAFHQQRVASATMLR